MEARFKTKDLNQLTAISKGVDLIPFSPSPIYFKIVWEYRL